MSRWRESSLPVDHVRRAVYLSYAQAMVASVYAASTGGMFLVGYALALGARDIHIGLLSTIPMFCVLAQLPGSLVVENGASRRRVTVAASLINVLGWGLIILIPFLATGASAGLRLGLLIAIATFVTIFGQIAGNARGSWVGDLVPALIRGTFFGRLGMYAGIVAAAFSLGEGYFLDTIKAHGIGAFSLLFGFGMLFGLANVGLFAAQPDVPITTGRNGRDSFRALLKKALHNRPLVIVIAYSTLWMMQMMSWPFLPVYMLRDLKMPFVGVGAVNAVHMVMGLLAAPFWGRVVNRYGSRPVLILCSAVTAIWPPLWLLYTSAGIVYTVVAPLNIIAGFMSAGVGVGMITLLYKVTPSAGRSTQLAAHSILVQLLAAPMPALGSCLPGVFRHLGWDVGLRGTIAAGGVFAIAATLTSLLLIEDHAKSVRELLSNLPRHLLSRASLR